MSQTYTLHPERKTLHGHFSRDLPPVLTLDAGWGLEPFEGGDYASRRDMQRREFEGRVKGLDDGHALIGPIAIEGAHPGLTLEVEIKTIQPAKWGFCVAGGWTDDNNQLLGLTESGTMHNWTLDPQAMIGRSQNGHSVALRPFMGVMGMPPDEPGTHPTAPPRIWGGNMDCKELVVGSTLYLPIPVEGGLFSVGDGHAVQGDGEVSGTAIECPMDLVELTFHVRDDFPVTTATANTPTGWLTMGFDTDLTPATYQALNAMLDLMERLFGIKRLDAIGLASLVVDLRVTQIVNGVRGVHAVLPHGSVR